MKESIKDMVDTISTTRLDEVLETFRGKYPPNANPIFTSQMISELAADCYTAGCRAGVEMALQALTPEEVH